ncbi:MAG TPA: hypothetical protein VKD21_15395 [Acidimicrobiales bacterium]|nr:hypothetical protein [Acidimicrobiales bacterium]
MLWFERDVVGALVGTDDPSVRSSVEAFVDGSLRDKPEHLRLGVAGQSVLLGSYVALLRTLGRLDGDDALRALLRSWENGRIGVVRQYVQAMQALVVFAENESASAPPKAA